MSRRNLRRLLCVAEKPSVAKEAARILSKGQSKSERGNSKFNPNHKFIETFQGEQVEVTFTSVAGHVYSLDFAEQYKWGNGVNPAELWRAEIVEYIDKDFKDMATNISTQAKYSFCVFLWLDNDREGEEISEEVEKLCKTTNPGIQVARARFSALSAHDVKRAFNNPTTINRNDAAAVRLRMELDLRIGAAFTRFLSQWKGKLDSTKVISFGTCQFPTLGFIVDAWKKHVSHQPEPYWFIQPTLSVEGNKYQVKWDRKYLFCKLSTVAILSSIMDNPICRVTSVVEKPKTNNKPLPLSTIELQKRCSRWIKISSATVMKCAEELYQGGFISYPRTETDAFPDNFNYQEIVQALTNSPDVGAYANKISNAIVPPRKGKHSDNAHTPIYPIKIPDSFKSQNSKKVYELIIRHFLACCSKDALGSETRAKFDIGGEEFHTKGLRIIERNWLDVYPYVKWEGNKVPNFVVGTTCPVSSIEIKTDKTKAPPLLTEPELLAKMNKEGIGTDATFQEHIAKIQERNYCTEKNRVFEPTPLGLALVNGYENMGFDFAKPKLRADLERALQDICAGRTQMQDTRRRYINSYEEAYHKSEQMRIFIDRSFAEQEARVRAQPQTRGGQPPAAPAPAPQPRRKATPQKKTKKPLKQSIVVSESDDESLSDSDI